ncbi:MAG: hypothetical protein A2028_03965 [Candidatus Aminicenantes bacterium RBG_19FT_COMBO_59_29]|nr:MAG: hypothetical protein A2028_03965 [Candidatus Aminicenantes bacterium RBG_19FT_COMBO_59_29]
MLPLSVDDSTTTLMMMWPPDESHGAISGLSCGFPIQISDSFKLFGRKSASSENRELSELQGPEL